MLLWHVNLTACLMVVQCSLSHATQNKPRLQRARCDELSASIMLHTVSTSENIANADSGTAEGMAKKLQLQTFTDLGRWAMVRHCAHTAFWGAVVVPLLVDAPKVAHALRHSENEGMVVPVGLQQKPTVTKKELKNCLWNTFKFGASCVVLSMGLFICLFPLHRCQFGRFDSGRRVKKLQTITGQIENGSSQWNELPRKSCESAQFFRMFTGPPTGTIDAKSRQITT